MLEAYQKQTEKQIGGVLKDILDTMSKEEIVFWLRGDMSFHIRKPKKSDVLFIRWQLQSDKLAKRSEANNEQLKSIDFKQRDKYARQFNESNDTEEKLRLIRKIEPYEKAFEKYCDESESIELAYKKLDKLYDQIDIERKKEQHKTAHWRRGD